MSPLARTTYPTSGSLPPERTEPADKGTVQLPAVLDVIAACRSHPGLADKAKIGLVRDVLGGSDCRGGPGDDTAAIALPPQGGGFVVAGGEALYPPFVRADPFAAGMGAVIANVNDVAASGGRVLGIVDTIIAGRSVAHQLLSGLRSAANLYGIPIVGGHLTLREDAESCLCAFGFGHAQRVLSAMNVEADQSLLLACCLEGTMRPDFPFFSSATQRAGHLAGDIELLAQAAEEELCLAAKDVSMAGLFGSLAMLLEPTGLGATVRLDAVPRPRGVPLERWLVSFPQFAFLLCTPTDRVRGCRTLFERRGLCCEEIGRVVDGGVISIGHSEGEEVFWDLSSEPVTGLHRPEPLVSQSP